MQPVLPVPYSSILTVSPFSGEMDICPPDTAPALDMVISGVTIYGNMANSRRVISALYPMTVEVSLQHFTETLHLQTCVFSF